MLNELYTFAEPVQVVPFSSLKWGKFTLLHTPIAWFVAKLQKTPPAVNKWSGNYRLSCHRERICKFIHLLSDALIYQLGVMCGHSCIGMSHHLRDNFQ